VFICQSHTSAYYTEFVCISSRRVMSIAPYLLHFSSGPFPLEPHSQLIS
jgi:hypothetical protein